jgi:peptide deformylase
MSILKVARMGHPVLRAAARPIERGEIRRPQLQGLLDDMIDTMMEYRGVGLAAPQVHEGLRVFVAQLADEESDEGRPDLDEEPTVIINPEIDVLDEHLVEDWEGCLSIPDIRGLVPRARAIVARGLDRTGAPLEIHASGFTARVIQHETDHLDGVLFFDRMSDFGSLTYLEEYTRYWRKNDD